MKLTKGEWRLLLLSECLKNYDNLYFLSEPIRKGGKQTILEEMTDKEFQYLDNELNEDDIPAIREALRGEWKFSGKVVDHGDRDYTCDYCQWQQIRYKYLCVNEKNKTWLSLGSVCVGRIIYGEEAMDNPDKVEEVERDLAKYKKYAKEAEQKEHDDVPRETKSMTLDEIREKRKEQHERISKYTTFLKSAGKSEDEFFVSLQRRWQAGYLLTEKQESALKRWAYKVSKEIGVDIP